MGRSEAEDAGGLSPVKDDNEAAAHFNRRTLPFFKRVDYKSNCAPAKSLFRGALAGESAPQSDP